MRHTTLALFCLTLSAATLGEDYRLPIPGLGAPSSPARARHSGQEVIYGEDDRHDLFEVEEAYRQAADSTVAVLKTAELKPKGTVYKLPASPTGSGRSWCSNERFYDQPSPAFCSGFLVGKDLIVTAGHCVEQDAGESCGDISFVFGFYMGSGQSARLEVPAQDIYQCREVVNRQLDDDSKRDWALVRVDPVQGHRPLRIRRDGEATLGSDVTVIGHPSGLPSKVTKGGKIREGTNPVYFTTDLDTYGGNSGSAVFNTESILAGEPLVEGILVRGSKDFVAGNREWDKAAGCYVSNRCADMGGEGCRGEEVTRIGLIGDIIPKLGETGGEAPAQDAPPADDDNTETPNADDPHIRNILDAVKSSR